MADGAPGTSLAAGALRRARLVTPDLVRARLFALARLEPEVARAAFPALLADVEGADFAVTDDLAADLDRARERLGA